MQAFTNVNAIYNGGYTNSYDYSTISVVIGGAQILLALGSIIMIIVNATKQPAVIPGYLLGLGAILIEFITPSFIYIFVLFAECGLYMKAGSKIKNENIIHESTHRTSKKTIKKTEWFYGDKNEQEEPKIQIQKNQEQEQKRKVKLDKELFEWKQLLDSGEIDEQTYIEETNKLIEKEKRRSERKKLF